MHHPVLYDYKIVGIGIGGEEQGCGDSKDEEDSD